MNKLKIKAFTLVELIVVITILAILGTIAFISLNGYSKTARDSTRTSDLSTMKTSLELFNLDAGKYPETTDSFNVTYSGSTIWTQGEFGDTTTNSVDKLDKIPTDPLTQRKYTYSVTKTKQEYQLAGLLEGDDVVLNLTEEVNAGDIEATAVVTGNYNGMMIKTLTGGVNCEILAIPSIISNQPSSVTQLTTILTNTGLVYNGKSNLPSNYISSKFKVDEGFDFSPNQLVVYSDSNSCKPIYDADDATARTALITNLQTAYTGTIIANEGVIAEITTADSGEIEAMASVIVNNNLGGELSGITIDDNTITLYKSCEEILTNIPSTLNQDDIYTIDPLVNGTGFDVYCDMTRNGGGWMLTTNVTGNTVVVPSNISTSLVANHTVSATFITTNNLRFSSALIEYNNDTKEYNSPINWFGQLDGIRLTNSLTSSVPSEIFFVSFSDVYTYIYDYSSSSTSILSGSISRYYICDGGGYYNVTGDFTSTYTDDARFKNKYNRAFAMTTKDLRGGTNSLNTGAHYCNQNTSGNLSGNLKVFVK